MPTGKQRYMRFAFEAGSLYKAQDASYDVSVLAWSVCVSAHRFATFILNSEN